VDLLLIKNRRKSKMGIMGEFLFGHQETIAEKADKVGFTVKPASDGNYTVSGVDADGQAATWNATEFETKCLLDHVHSVNLGDAYLEQHYGSESQGDTSRDCEIKHEVREYRLQALEDETKPGWKRLLGL
jgi:hypothetical protein